VVLKAERRTEFTDTIAGDADLDLAFGKRRPRGRFDLARSCLVKPLDLGCRRLRTCPRCGSGESRRTDHCSSEKSPSRKRIHAFSTFMM